jgi:uncharacterized membrane protein YeaQ/YmgE (transglycosylase-associated protein family)
MIPYDPRRHVMAAIVVLGLAGIFGFALLSAKLGIAFAIPVGIIGALAAGFSLTGPLGKALARNLEGVAPHSDETTGHLLAELDELRGRVQELEERVDFSERLLAQQSQTPDR